MDVPFEPAVELARSGDVTAKVNGILLHSRFDPVREAEKLAATVPADTAVVVLGGFGLGYVAEALVRSAPERTLIVAEADGSLITRLASIRSISPLLNNPGVTILSGGEPGDIRSLLAGGPTGSRIHLLLWQPSVKLFPEWYGELKLTVEETVRRRQVNARTLDRFGRLWVRNLAANVPQLHKALSLEPWRNRFSGIPALVLAGGPTLEQLLPSLSRLAESHLLIAVDTALPAVMREGVVPDIVAAVDPQYWNTRHLDRCDMNSEKMLILTESATHPAVFRCLKGRPWFARTRFPLGTILEDAAGIRGELNAGGSVATAAWELAIHLGCSPVTIAGLDLGFPGGRTHYSGSLSRERPHLFSGRTQPSQNFFFHALRDASPYFTRSANGGTILTDVRMDVYAAWFAENVKKNQNGKLNRLGADGREIPGLPIINLEECLSRESRRTEIKGHLEEIRRTPETCGSRARVRKAVEDIVAALTDLNERSEAGREFVVAAERALKNNHDPSVFLRRLEKIDKDILSGGGREVVSFLLQPIILDIASNSGGDGEKALGLSHDLYSAISDSASYHLTYLKKVTFPDEKAILQI